MAAPANSKQDIDSPSIAIIATKVNKMDLDICVTNKMSTETINTIQIADPSKTTAPLTRMGTAVTPCYAYIFMTDIPLREKDIKNIENYWIRKKNTVQNFGINQIL